jgi:hypothetical protein
MTTLETGIAKSVRSSLAARLASYLRLNARFYTGAGAPCARGTVLECRVRAMPDYLPGFIGDLVTLCQDGSEQVERINFRCARILVSGRDERFFVKEFPRLRAIHDLERRLRCSRVDRAWRAGHLLPKLGVSTPRPIGTAQSRATDGAVTEYLITEWLESARGFTDLIAAAGRDERRELLAEFTGEMSRWHDLGIYLRDLVKNVLITVEAGQRRYWLTDLDGLHPIRWPSRARVLFHMRQLAHWVKPTAEEATLIATSYSRGTQSDLGAAARSALLAD